MANRSIQDPRLAVAEAQQAFTVGDSQIWIEGENAFLSAPEFLAVDVHKKCSNPGSELLDAIDLARAIVFA